MRARFLRLVVLPLLAALAASFGAYSYLSTLESKKKPAGLQPVVVAAKQLPPRTVLTREMLSTKELPLEFVDGAMITSLDDASGKTTTVPLAQGEIIYRNKLASKDQKTALAYHVPVGKRAVTIAVNEVSGVAGLVEAGDRVDLILTLSREVVGKETSRLVLEDVPVLAVVQSMEVRQEPGRDLKGYTSLTLAVSPDQAVLIGFGEKYGAFKLALRAPGDNAVKGELQVSSDRFR
ncbi:MAG: Flp pilus assembly protein CpaB [Firmicutes bacterium]|nr:Flp pilus assembly protein CpaB [Bacillota bacterium]